MRHELSNGQRGALKTLAERGPMSEGMWRRAVAARFQVWALQHHGLVEMLAYQPGKGKPKWAITDAGRGALEEAAA